MEVSRDSALYYLTSSTFGMICNCVLSKGHFATHAAAGEERIFPRNRNELRGAILEGWLWPRRSSARHSRRQSSNSNFGACRLAPTPYIFHKMSGTAYKIVEYMSQINLNAAELRLQPVEAAQAAAGHPSRPSSRLRGPKRPRSSRPRAYDIRCRSPAKKCRAQVLKR
jgi:hypothetical protein